WLQKVSDNYRVHYNMKQSDFFWLEHLKQSVIEDVQGFNLGVEHALELARTPDRSFHYIEALESDLLLIQQVEKETDWNQLQSLFQESTFQSLSRKRVECN